MGSPSREAGSMDLSYIESASEQIREALKDKQGCTSGKEYGGAWNNRVSCEAIIEQKPGKRAFDGFDLAMNPRVLA